MCKNVFIFSETMLLKVPFAFSVENVGLKSTPPPVVTNINFGRIHKIIKTQVITLGSYHLMEAKLFWSTNVLEVRAPSKNCESKGSQFN